MAYVKDDEAARRATAGRGPSRMDLCLMVLVLSALCFAWRAAPNDTSGELRARGLGDSARAALSAHVGVTANGDQAKSATH